MKKFIELTRNFVEKIGKQNFILIVFIILILGITGLYQTFSLYTSSDGISFIDGIKTYKFILTGDSENSVTIASGSSKYLAITVTNPEELALKYAIYYSTSSDLEKINIGYLETSEYKGTDIIKANQDYIVNCRVTNMSGSNVTINFGIKYGFNNEEAIILESDQNYLEKFKVAYLVEARDGDYVTYLGRNGCDFTSGSCGGKNANYSNSTSLGYCWDSAYQFSTIGWRLAYIDDSIPYLISAGAPDCLSTDASGNHSSSVANNYETTAGFPIHRAKMSEISLSYCNSNYAYGEECSSSNSWTMNANDLVGVTNGTAVFSTAECLSGVASATCGYGNNLIDNGSYYWFDEITASGFYHWHPSVRYISSYYTLIPAGVRPVLKLKEDVRIISGEGTTELPYRIATDATLIKDLSGNKNHAINQDAGWDKTNGTIVTDSTTTYVDAGLRRHDFGADITMITKVKFNTLNNDIREQGIFANFEGGGAGFAVLNGYLTFEIYINGAYYYYCSTITPTVDTWYTLVGTYDGTNIKFYINGILATLNTSVSGSASSVSGTIGVSPYSFYLGGNPQIGDTIFNYIGTDYYTGSGVNAVFDDALIFDRAITESEVTSNYSGDITLGNKTGLLLYYDFQGEEEQIAMSVTDGVTTYYTSLSDAVAAASTTTTTTITLLENTVEIVKIESALNDTIIDLNENRLTGKFFNLNTSSNVTLKNGTIASDGTGDSVTNHGTMNIENGTYINGTINGHGIINNGGTMTINDGLFSLTNKSSVAGTIYNNLYNDTKGTLTITGGTIDTVGFGLVNHGSTTKVTDMNINLSTTARAGLLNRESGTTNVYTSTIDASAAIQNDSGTVIVRESDVLGSIGGIVYRFTWESSADAEWQIYGQSDAACAVWTAKTNSSGNDQDDILWTTASSYTGPYNTYLYCGINKSDHNNESGTYNTHIYNAAHTTYYYGSSFTMP